MAYSNNKQKETVKRPQKPSFDSCSEVRNRAVVALEEMKRVESAKSSQLVKIRIDARTVVYATPERAEQIRAELGEAAPLRGCALEAKMQS